MKDKILYLIIGILIGAIVTTSAFLIYNKTLEKNSNQSEMMQMKEDGQMQPPSNGNMGEPPSMPNQNGGTPPEKPSSSNNNNV